MAAPSVENENQIVPTIRAAVADRVEKTTLRKVAREIGMTPSGLTKFIGGAVPYRRTLRKLEA